MPCGTAPTRAEEKSREDEKTYQAIHKRVWSYG